MTYPSLGRRKHYFSDLRNLDEIYFVSPLTTVTLPHILAEDACYLERNFCVFSRVQKGIKGLHTFVLVSLNALINVTVVLEMRQSIHDCRLQVLYGSVFLQLFETFSFVNVPIYIIILQLGLCRFNCYFISNHHHPSVPASVHLS